MARQEGGRGRAHKLSTATVRRRQHHEFPAAARRGLPARASQLRRMPNNSSIQCDRAPGCCRAGCNSAQAALGHRWPGPRTRPRLLRAAAVRKRRCHDRTTPAIASAQLAKTETWPGVTRREAVAVGVLWSGLAGLAPGASTGWHHHGSMRRACTWYPARCGSNSAWPDHGGIAGAGPPRCGAGDHELVVAFASHSTNVGCAGSSITAIGPAPQTKDRPGRTYGPPRLRGVRRVIRSTAGASRKCGPASGLRAAQRALPAGAGHRALRWWCQ
jgi:hypothetical protein